MLSPSINKVFTYLLTYFLSKWSAKGFTLTLQDTRSIHDSMNLSKIEFIAYIYFLYYQSSINFQFSPYLAGFLAYFELNQT